MLYLSYIYVIFMLYLCYIYVAEWNAQNYVIHLGTSGFEQHSGWYTRHTSTCQMLMEWHFFPLIQEFPVRNDSSASPLYETELAQEHSRTFVRTDKVENTCHLIKRKNNRASRVLFARAMISKTEINYFARERPDAVFLKGNF